MAMPEVRSTHMDWTADLVRQLPDDGYRYEVVDGELLVSPAPTYAHQRTCLHLWSRLEQFLRAHSIGAALSAPADVEFTPRRVVQPDVFALRFVNGKVSEGPVPTTDLLVAAEVLSLSTARADRHTKRRMYMEEGVREYWIVDIDARLIERWRPGEARPEVCEERLEWHVEGHVDVMVIDLHVFFREVLEIF